MRKVFSLIVGLLPTMFFIGSVAADGMLSSTPLPFSGKPPAIPQKTVIVTPVKPVVSTETTKPEADTTPGPVSTATSVETIPYPSWIGGYESGSKNFGMGEETANVKPVRRVPVCGCAQPVSHNRPTRRSIIRAYYEQMEKRIAALMG